MQVQGFSREVELDRGPRSTTFRAVRDSDGVDVILKVLATQSAQPGDLGRYRYAWEITRHLDLPGICRTLALLEDGASPVLVTEDIGATSLRSKLAAGPLGLEPGLRTAVQLAEALQRLHDAGIVHRDINPSNVVVTGDQLQIIDFDLATRLEGTIATGLEGTLAYIAPEQTGRVARPVDRRADLYSLGATLYEVFSGAPPYGDGDTSALVHAHIAIQAPVLGGVPAVVSQIVARLLQKNPDERYQSAGGLAADLRRCLDALADRRAQQGATPPPGDLGVAAFELGQHDHDGRLRTPRKLYGRESERATLLASLDAVCTGGSQLVLVAGYSGIGKSSLVHELDEPVVAAHGRFLSGKFEAVAPTPYAGWLQLLRALIDDVLGAPEAEVARARAEMLAALGDDGGALVKVLPELEAVVGPQPDAPALPPL